MLFVPSFVRVTAVLAAKWAERHDRARPTTHDHARPRMTDHARTTTHDRPRTHDRTRPCTTDRARPRTTTHHHARPRTTTHDRPRTHDRAWPTTHDRARPTTAAIFVWGSGTHPTPVGFRGLNCLARLALARERTPSTVYWKVKIVRKRKFDKMTISNFKWLSGNTVQRDMSLVWWASTTFILSISPKGSSHKFAKS